MRGAENGLSDMESDNLKGETSEIRNWEREGKGKEGKGTERRRGKERGDAHSVHNS